MYYYKTKPFLHQIDGLDYGMHHDKWFLGDEQGLGKTKQAIDIAINRKIELGYKHCLIVCGVNTLKWNWLNEISIHSDETGYILGQKTDSKGNIRIGSMKDRISDLNRFSELPYFIITNIESFRDIVFANMIRDLCKDELQMCVVDEIHKCSNPQAQQTKGFLKCSPKCRIAMTGTPVLNSPLDLYIILKWLDIEYHSFYQFRSYYCIMGGFGGYQIVGYKNMDKLTTQTHSVMLRRLKSDVLDLPDKLYVDDVIDMLPRQEKLYRDIKNEITENIDKVILSPSPLSALIRLRQCTGYTGILSTEVEESAKLDRLEELIEDAVANNDKVIVFSNWTNITDVIFKRLKKYNPAIITGGVKDNERSLQQDKFMKDDSCKVIIGTIGALGTGVTLTAAHTIIFVDEPWNKALFDQAVDRAHRIGTTGNITIYSIMCKNTIDERIHSIIYKKGAVSAALLDGEATGNKTELINYLLS